jgi:hypothetical protein
MKRVAFGLLLLLGVVELPLACSTKVPLATVNALCEYDEQCAQGLACRCVRRRNPDDEGPDEIIKPGICQTSAYRCATDAGVDETSVIDTGTVVDSAAVDSGVTDSGTPEVSDVGDAADGG